MRSVLKKIFIATGLFFLINVLLLLSLRGFHPSINQHEPGPPIEKVTNPKFANSFSSTLSKSSSPKINAILPVVIFGCNRPRALQTQIETLLRIRRNSESNPIIVSLDCHDEKTIETAKSFSDKITKIIELPDLGPLDVPEKFSHMSGYYKISRHYNYSINYVLNVLNYEAIIITEDDLELSPDFLDYFQKLYPLLISDKSLWCISAWNDNGFDKRIARNSTLLHRTDFFPGLGWLLTKYIWNEIKSNWPPGFWDDWMRLPEQRRGRACIRPEISRTAISPEGKKGVSQGQHYERYLRKILKNNDPIDWNSIDVNYLFKNFYDSDFQSRVDSCRIITLSEIDQIENDIKCVQIRYTNEKEFRAIADTLGIMNDFKSDVPRTAYRGVVQCQYGQTTIFISPNQRPWKSYG